MKMTFWFNCNANKNKKRTKITNILLRNSSFHSRLITMSGHIFHFRCPQHLELYGIGKNPRNFLIHNPAFDIGKGIGEE